MSLQKLDLGALLRKQQEELQGYVIDILRMSEISDRAFTQMERSVKKTFREKTDALVETLKELQEEGFEISSRPSYTPDK